MLWLCCGCVLVQMSLSCGCAVVDLRLWLSSRHRTHASFSRLIVCVWSRFPSPSRYLSSESRKSFAVSADVGPHAREELRASSSTIAEQGVQIRITMFFPCIGHTGRREELLKHTSCRN